MSKAGFTLLEMLVVLAILSVATAAALTLARPPSNTVTQRIAVQKLVALANEVRASAILRSATTELVIDIKSKKAFSLGPPARSLSLPQSTELTVTTAQGLIENREAKFAFFPDGTASGGRITLSGVTGEQILIIDWLTGTTTLE